MKIFHKILKTQPLSEWPLFKNLTFGLLFVVQLQKTSVVNTRQLQGNLYTAVRIGSN